MKSAIVVAVAVATLSSFPLIAKQQADPAAQQQQQQSAPSATQPGQTPTGQNGVPAQAGQAAVTPAGNTAAPLELRPVTGELEKKLDTKSAKTGDSVVVKTGEDVKTADGTNIPKGSKLIGHVTGVQARGEGKQNSQLAIQFDHAELKGGQNLPIQSVIQSVSPAEAEAGPGMASGSSGSPMGSAPAGGIAGTPATGGGMNSPTNNSGMNNNRQAGQMTASPEQSMPNAGGNSSAPAAGTIVSQKGNVAIRTTAIPGVLLANNVNGQPFSNASGMLLGANRDVHLDSGTQVVLQVATMAGSSANGSATPNR